MDDGGGNGGGSFRVKHGSDAAKVTDVHEAGAGEVRDVVGEREMRMYVYGCVYVCLYMSICMYGFVYVCLHAQAHMSHTRSPSSIEYANHMHICQ